MSIELFGWFLNFIALFIGIYHIGLYCRENRFFDGLSQDEIALTIIGSMVVFAILVGVPYLGAVVTLLFVTFQMGYQKPSSK